jgi:DNA-binding XRE family transcriptional regulator
VNRREQIARLRLDLAEAKQGHLPNPGIDEPWQQEMSAEARERVWQQFTQPQIVARLETCIAELEAEAEREAPQGLKELREAAGLTQSDLARISGVSEKQIGRIERGENKPEPRTVRALADSLSQKLARIVDPAELLAEAS